MIDYSTSAACQSRGAFPSDTPCHIQLLGGLSLTVASETTTRFRTAKTGSLLAFLAYHLRRDHPRELLIETFWPECDVEAGRHSLSTALTSIRHLLERGAPGLGEKVLLSDRHAVRLAPDHLVTDVATVEAAVKAAESASDKMERVAHLESAAAAYGGDLLPGMYDEWIFPEQQRLQEIYFQVLTQLVSHFEASGDAHRALAHALRAVKAEPLREKAHQDVIRLSMSLGNVEFAKRQYGELRRRLQSELDVEPSEETLALLSRPDSRHARPPTPAPERVRPSPASSPLEPVGGAVPLGSRFYLERPVDSLLQDAISRQESIVLINGPRQVGKTSLLARGLEHARESGARVVLTHFQSLSTAHLETADTLLLTFAEMIQEQLEVSDPPETVWDTRRGSSLSLRRYLRRVVLNGFDGPLIWALDEADRIFSCSYGSEVFGLFRSWHDERALDPSGPWSRLTMAIAYSTEAHLFITDLNQSPFNVGTRLTLQDFTGDQVLEMNRRYGSPLQGDSDIQRFLRLAGGHPYLVRRMLHTLATNEATFPELEERCASDHWILGDHLRRMRLLLGQAPVLREALRSLPSGRGKMGREAFYRLRSAGILAGDSPAAARYRCGLYERYFSQIHDDAEQTDDLGAC